MPLDLKGMDELIAKLERLGHAEIAKERALDAGASYMRDKIAANTPRSNIAHEHAADHIIVSKKEDSREIGPAHGYSYLRFPEFGTSKQPAQGFMSKTFHEEIGKTREIMRDSLKKDLGL